MTTNFDPVAYFYARERQRRRGEMWENARRACPTEEDFEKAKHAIERSVDQRLHHEFGQL